MAHMLSLSASSLLSWSYQSSKQCSVLVGENTQIVTPSKPNAPESNTSTSSRPKTPSNGGNVNSSPMANRKRREVDEPPILLASVLSDQHFSNSSNDTQHGVGSLLHENTSVDTPPGEEIDSLMVDSFPSSSESVPSSGATEMSVESSESTSISFSSPTSDSPTTSDDTFETETVIDYIDDEFTTTIVSHAETTSASSIRDDKIESTTTSSSSDSTSDISQSTVMSDITTTLLDKKLDEPNHDIVQADEPEFDFPYNEDVDIITFDEKPPVDVIDIVSLDKRPSMTNSMYNTTSNNTVSQQNETISSIPMEDISSFNNPSTLHELNQTNLGGANPNIKIINLAPSKYSNNSKHLRVNITVSAQNGLMSEEEQVYVLSVTIPTEGKVPAPTMSEYKEYPQEQNKFEVEKENGEPGGACECSCPSLDINDYFADYNDSSEFDLNETNIETSPSSTVMVTESDKFSTSDLRTTESVSSTTDMDNWTNFCDTSTRLPPPPTILILEGRINVMLFGD